MHRLRCSGIFEFFCMCRGFCHRTESDLFLFLIQYFETLYFSEAEYAFRLKKRIIPLCMEQGYRPDGWLGLVIGAKIVYDFSAKYLFDNKNKMKELMKAINMMM